MQRDLPHRLLGAALYAWFREIVLPLWQQHAIGIEPSSPLDLEKALMEQTEQHDQLFHSVKIAYISSAVYDDENIEEDGGAREPTTKVSENPEYPCFVGTRRMEKIFEYLSLFSAPTAYPIITQVRKIETGHRSKRQRQHLTIKLENPLKDEKSDGYKYSNGWSCLCLYSQYRFIVLEELRNDFNYDDVTKGGLTFLFLNPKYAECSVRVLHNLMIQHVTLNQWTHAITLMKTFCNLMTFFLFPNFSVEMDYFGFRLFTDFKELIENFFYHKKSRIKIRYSIQEKTLDEILRNHDHVANMDLNAIRNYSSSEQDYSSSKTQIEEFSVCHDGGSHSMTIRLYTTFLGNSFLKIKALSTSIHTHCAINRQEWLNQAANDSTGITHLYDILFSRYTVQMQ